MNHYGKLCFKDAVLSKRKIKALIDDGKIGGWDDPALLTWRGAKRRGLSHDGLIQFLSKVGITKSVVEMEQNSLWGINLKIVDKLSTRLIALKDPVELMTIATEITEHEREIPRFKRNPKLGKRKVVYSNSILMERSDVETLKIGEEVTLINWGNVFFRGDNQFELNLDGDFKKTEKKLCWIPEKSSSCVKVTKISVKNGEICKSLYYLGVEDEINNIPNGHFVQFMKLGYYIIDSRENGLIELQNE